jgi:phenylpropionate dioxygenase-like ring-hydroxylating dioxygenase large terminal subunit
MRHEEQVALIQRARSLIATGATEHGEPASSPVERYLDSERFEREMARVIRRHPLAVCASASLAQTGDSFAVDVAGLPLLLVRAVDGSVNGFVNACRHRGARLKPAGLSSQEVLVCPYHSWSYRLNGELRGRPHADRFPHAPASGCTLARVPVAEAVGFVWVVPRVLDASESPTIDIRAWLGRFGDDLRSWGYDDWVPFHQRRFGNAANWKIPFEGNLETYHFQYAHRQSIAPLFYDNLLIADHDRQHQRLFLPKRSIESLPDGRVQDGPVQDWQIGSHANILYFFFPSTLILHEGDHANAFCVLPEAVDRSTVLGTTLIPQAAATDKAKAYWLKNVDSFWGALNEDFALGVSAQSTFASGANRSLCFGTTEYCASKFHADVEAEIGSP